MTDAVFEPTSTIQKGGKQITGILASFGLPEPAANEVKTPEPSSPLEAVSLEPAKVHPQSHTAKAALSYAPGEEMMLPYPADLGMWMNWDVGMAKGGYPMKAPMGKGTWPAAGAFPGWIPPPPPQLGHMGFDGAPYWMGILQPEKAEKPEKPDKAAAKSRTANEAVKQFHKTKLCSFFQKGLCNRGEECTFAHCAGELEFTPDLAKTSLCLAWKAGTCPLSPTECRFAHGKHDLRTFPQKQSRQRLQKLGRDLLDLLNKAPDANNHLDLDADTLGVDDYLLMKLEERESKESGADHWNEDTFGACTDDWDFSQVLHKENLPIGPPPGLAAGQATKPEASARTPMSTSSGSDGGAPDSDSDWSAAEANQATAFKTAMNMQ